MMSSFLACLGFDERLPRHGRVDLRFLVRRNAIGRRDRQHLRYRVHAIPLRDADRLVVVFGSAGSDRKEERPGGRPRRCRSRCTCSATRALSGGCCLLSSSSSGAALAASRRFAPTVVCAFFVHAAPVFDGDLDAGKTHRLFREDQIDFERLRKVEQLAARCFVGGNRVDAVRRNAQPEIGQPCLDVCHLVRADPVVEIRADGFDECDACRIDSRGRVQEGQSRRTRRSGCPLASRAVRPPCHAGADCRAAASASPFARRRFRRS